QRCLAACGWRLRNVRGRYYESCATKRCRVIRPADRVRNWQVWLAESGTACVGVSGGADWVVVAHEIVAEDGFQSSLLLGGEISAPLVIFALEGSRLNDALESGDPIKPGKL